MRLARVIQMRRTGKGCLSYLIGSAAGEAAAIDPSVSPGVYVDLANRHRWSIRYVLDTHIHADHLSRACDLAGKTNAKLLLPGQERAKFEFVAIADGEHLQIAMPASPRCTPPATPMRARVFTHQGTPWTQRATSSDLVPEFRS